MSGGVVSGVLALRGVVVAALRDDAGLMALVNRVEDAGAPKQSAPALIVGQFVATDWGARGVEGLSVRVPLSLVDRGDAPDRLDAAAMRVAAVMGMLPAMAGGWRIGAVRAERVRTSRGADGRWTMLAEYLVRMSRVV